MAFNSTRSGMADVRLSVVATYGERLRKVLCFQPLELHLWNKGDWQVTVPTTGDGIQVLCIWQSWFDFG